MFRGFHYSPSPCTLNFDESHALRRRPVEPFEEELPFIMGTTLLPFGSRRAHERADHNKGRNGAFRHRLQHK